MKTRALAILLLAPLAAADGELLELRPEDPGFGHVFGGATALAGDLAVVGAYRDDQNGTSAGALYVFNSTSGAQLRKLVPQDVEANDLFGLVVAIDGAGRVLGQAPYDDDMGTAAGAVYVFDPSTGAQVAKFVASDGGPFDYLGAALDVENTTAAAGAPLSLGNGQYSGSVYLFDTATGVELRKLVPSDGAADDAFGAATAIGGGRVFVGAPRDDDSGPDSGSVYVFNAATGARLAKLTAADGAAGDNFGAQLALDGGVLVVTAPFDDDSGPDSGSAYIFDAATGAQGPKLVANDGAAGDFFGLALDAADGRAVIGAPHDQPAGLFSGSAYVFDLTSGVQVRKLTSAGGTPEDRFGSAVALDGTRALIGAPHADGASVASGAASLHDVRAPLGTAYCGPATPNSSGASAELFAFGSPSALESDVLLAARGLPPGQFAIFVNATTTGSVVPPGSQGTLCLGSAIGRYTQNILVAGPAGAVSLELDLASTPTPGGLVAVQAGQTWNFQTWFRDLNPGSTSNFTDAVSITFQ